jgi:hypothetical protein
MFVYRHMQVRNLLEFPDFGGGDMSHDDRRTALQNSIGFHKPLAAVAIFLGVVALEDFIRDIGARLADSPLVTQLFPEAGGLRMQAVKKIAERPFARLDKDPANLVDPEDVNKLFSSCIGVQPFSESEFPRLRDLALLRHTVAHHAAVVRAVDQPRFQYYSVNPGRTVNPPVEFVRETCDYLYKIGRTFEEALKQRIFSAVVPALGADWSTRTPPELLDLIELFNYFGKVVQGRGPVGVSTDGHEEEERMRAESVRVREELLQLCIEELRASHA